MSPADASKDVDALRKAMKGLGTDEATLIRILAHADPLYIAKLKHTFTQRLGRSLEKDVKSEVSGNLERILLTFIHGPLLQDVNAVRNAVKGLGTNEQLLNDVLVGRSNADLNAIKRAYSDTFHRSLDQDVSDDLSGRTRQIFTMILAANRPEETAPIDPQAINHDVDELHNALLRPADSDIIVIARILTGRSDAQLRAIDQTYNQLHKPSLYKHIVDGVTGHPKDIFVAMLRRATDPVTYDMEKIRDCLTGYGIKPNDTLLSERISRLHWNKPHMHAVKEAYKKKCGKDLVKSLAEATSGDYMRALIAAMDA
jgi:annexin A7/11